MPPLRLDRRHRSVDIATVTMNPAVDVSTSVDRVVPIHKLRCSSLLRDPGGGGINVARVVRRLGGGVAAVYTAGGSMGQLLRQLVEREGIDSRAVQIAEETREDFAVREDASGQQFRFVLPGPQVSPHEWAQCLDTLASLRPFPSYLVASGSLAPGIPEDFYARIARLAKGHHAKLVVDTSGSSLRAALKEGVYLVKPNRRELAELVGRMLDQEAAWAAACREIVEGQQAAVVALTLGDQGAMLVTHEGTWRAPGLAVEAVSAVGAGDSFLGGMVWSLAAGHAVEEAFRYGVAAGTAAVLRSGTELCRREDVVRLLGEVTLEAI
ncbi:MAG: 1-phosphofructokinase family hexose kinase [Micropepsaceae bacterium]